MSRRSRQPSRACHCRRIAAATDRLLEQSRHAGDCFPKATGTSNACHDANIGAEIDGQIVAAVATKNGAARIRAQRIARPALVGAGDARKRRARSRPRRVHQTRPQAHRGVVEALGGTQPPAQSQSVPLGAVDADLLHQSRRQEPASQPAQNPRTRQRRIAQAIWPRLTGYGRAFAPCCRRRALAMLAPARA